MIWGLGIVLGWLLGSSMLVLWMMGRDTRSWSDECQNQPLKPLPNKIHPK